MPNRDGTGPRWNTNSLWQCRVQTQSTTNEVNTIAVADQYQMPIGRGLARNGGSRGWVQGCGRRRGGGRGRGLGMGRGGI